MPVVERIAGPGISPNDIHMVIPDCVTFRTEQERQEFDAFMHKCVRQALMHAADTLRGMLHNTQNASKLADEFASRLGL